MNLTDIMKMTEDQSRDYLEKIRWANGPVCPHCKSDKFMKLQGKSTRKGLHKCKECRKQYTVTIGTVFEGSHIPLNKWIAAFYLMCSSKKGVSALQLKRQLGLAYKSAWHMCHRIRFAMTEPHTIDNQIGGIVEVDETYIGGKKENNAFGPEPKKIPVVALVSRDGKAKARVVKYCDAKSLKKAINDNVNMWATIYTDEHRSYQGIGKEFEGGHETVIHSKKQYVKEGGISTNRVESFFSLLKRGIVGSFHHVSKDHLHRYCEEFAFRWSNRHLKDDEITAIAVEMAEGKKLPYRNRIKGLIDRN